MSSECKHDVRFAVVVVVGVVAVASKVPAVVAAKDVVREAECDALVVVVTLAEAAAVVDVTHATAPDAVLVVDTVQHHIGQSRIRCKSAFKKWYVRAVAALRVVVAAADVVLAVAEVTASEVLCVAARAEMAVNAFETESDAEAVLVIEAVDEVVAASVAATVLVPFVEAANVAMSDAELVDAATVVVLSSIETT